MRGDASLTGIIDAAKTRGCIRFCIGYNAVTDNLTPTTFPATTPLKLFRTNPVSHPRYPNLYCTGAAEEEYAPDGRILQTLKADGSSLPLGMTTPSNVLGDGADVRGKRARYKKSKITLRFEPLPYICINDDTPSTGEFQRNCWIDQEPRADLLNVSGFQLIYAEGNATAGFSSAPAGNKFPGEIAQVVVKSDIRFKWHQVPELWLMKNGTFFPSRILYRIGTLNNATFFGYPKGTLLLQGVKLVRSPWTLFQSKAQPGDAVESRWQYDVEFAMSYFNPSKGFTNVPTDPFRIVTNLGHNCCPWRGGLLAAGVPTSDANAGQWFIASYDGQVPRAFDAANNNKEGANCMFSYTDFAKLFDAADNGASDGL